MARRSSSSSSSSVALALGLILMAFVGQCYGQLKVEFYTGRCKNVNVEEVIFRIVRAHFIKDKDTVADLIRLHFHDCFVRGCDASILLDGKNTEKTSPPNLTVAGFKIIDEAKAALEKICPGVVSCADIIVIAARHAMFLAGARWYDVETGRRDGRVSIANEALNNLPGPNIPIPAAVNVFARRGLNVEDFVLLLGCHTVGTAHCPAFQNRLYNFQNTGRSDPSINPTLLSSLKKTCPRFGNSNAEAFLDQTKGSQFVVDNGFYKALLARKGILEVDQQMALHPLTKGIVKRLANNNNEFISKVGKSIVKMGRIGVLTGREGEIRKSCRSVNKF